MVSNPSCWVPETEDDLRGICPATPPNWRLCSGRRWRATRLRLLVRVTFALGIFPQQLSDKVWGNAEVGGCQVLQGGRKVQQSTDGGGAEYAEGFPYSEYRAVSPRCGRQSRRSATARQFPPVREGWQPTVALFRPVLFGAGILPMNALMGSRYEARRHATGRKWLALAKGKPGTAIQFQRRELVAVPVLRRKRRREARSGACREPARRTRRR